MLIEFSVANFRSIKERATLSMVASSNDEHDATHTFQAVGQLRLLRTAAIYGPNASGKSNFVQALNVMRNIVLESSKTQRGDKIPVIPHLFDVTSAKKPTEFEVIFISKGIRYQYGFVANSDRVFEEWLFAYPKGRAQRWFSRVYNEENKNYNTVFSEKLLGSKQLWTEATRENSLLLATAVQLNSTQLSSVFDWFDEVIGVIGFRDGFPQFTARLCKKSLSKKVVLNFLTAADIDIKDIKIEENKIDMTKFPDMPEEMRKDYESRTYFDISFIHNVKGGKSISLDLDEESDGTQKLFSLIGPWMETLATGGIIFADELHDNLHPHMLKFLVSLFNNDDLNSHGAQLIFTTHDVAILDQKYLRRDQIWFVSKKSDNSSKLYPLSEFSPRKDREDLGKNYLAGKYGALPYFKDIANSMGVEIGE